MGNSCKKGITADPKQPKEQKHHRHIPFRGSVGHTSRTRTRSDHMGKDDSQVKSKGSSKSDYDQDFAQFDTLSNIFIAKNAGTSYVPNPVEKKQKLLEIDEQILEEDPSSLMSKYSARAAVQFTLPKDRAGPVFLPTLDYASVCKF